MIFTIREKSNWDKMVTGLKYADSYLRKKKTNLSASQKEILDSLESKGFAIIENFMTQDQLKPLDFNIKERLQNLDFEFPFISQKKVDPVIHKELLESYFIRGNIKEVQVCKEEVHNLCYESLLEQFQPSTLKLFNPPNNQEFWNLWLSPFLLEIIESYMGLTPYLAEAYTR